MGLLDIAGIAAPIIGGMAGGAASGQNAQMNARQRSLEQLLAQLQNQAAMEEGFLNRDRSGAAQVAQLDPLGQQQQFAQRQKMMQALLGGLSGGAGQLGPANPAIASRIQSGGNLIQQMAQQAQQSGAFSDQATGRSLANFQGNLKQINPYAQFGSLGDFGLDAALDNDVQMAGDSTLSRRGAYEDAMRDSMSRSVGLAEKEFQNAQQEHKGSPWWKKILGPAAGIAANFIPGVGPLISAGIGAAIGGASDGVRGAILGGGSGYGTDYLMDKFGGRSGPQLNNQMGSVAGFNVPGVGNAQVAPDAQMLLQGQGNGQLAGFAGPVSMNRPQRQDVRTAGVRNFISPQDLALAGGGRPENPQWQPGEIPLPTTADYFKQFEVKGTGLPPLPGMGGAFTSGATHLGEIVGPTAMKQIGSGSTIRGLLGGGGPGPAGIPGGGSGIPALEGIMQKVLPQGAAQRLLPQNTATMEEIGALMQKLQSAPNVNAAQAVLTRLQPLLKNLPGNMVPQLAGNQTKAALASGVSGANRAALMRNAIRGVK